MPEDESISERTFELTALHSNGAEPAEKRLWPGIKKAAAPWRDDALAISKSAPLRPTFIFLLSFQRKEVQFVKL